LQESAGVHVARYLQGHVKAAETVAAIDRLYRESTGGAA
jgi:hypothetical protein